MDRSTVRLIHGIAAALAVTGSSARGDAQSPGYPLGEVVVSTRRPVSEEAGTVRTLTRDDLAASGARTLDEALMLLPGVSVRTGGAGIPRIDVRGFRGRHVVLLLDGIPLNSTYDGQVDPSLIPVEQIAAITVTMGTGSVLYEQGGLGGTINIITRRGAPGMAVEATAEQRSGDSRLVQGTLSGGSARVDAFLSGSASTSDGFPSLIGSPGAGTSARRLRLNSDRGRSNLFASVTAEPSRRWRLGAVLATTHGHLGLPPNAAALTNPADRFANRAVFERIDDQDGAAGHVATSVAVSPRVTARGWAFLDALDQQTNRYDDSTFTSMRDSTVRGTYRERADTRLGGATLQLAVALPYGGRLSLAGSTERDRWNSTGTIRDVPRGGGGGGGGAGGGNGGGGSSGGGSQPAWYDVRAFSAARTLERQALAIDAEVRPTHTSGVAAGFAHHWLAKDSSGTDAANTATLSGFLDLGPRTRLRAAAARTARFPTIRQLYDPDGGNAALRTERATTAEVGVERQLARRSRVGITLFRTDATNYIERQEPGAAFENFDAYRFTGVEIGAESHPSSGVFVRGGYTYLDTEDRSPGAGREALQYRPRHRGTLEARYAVPFGLDASASVLRVADQVYYSRQAPVVSRRLPDYTIASARLAVRVWRGAATIFAGADNLFDAHYEEEYGAPAATRMLYVGFSARWRRPFTTDVTGGAR